MSLHRPLNIFVPHCSDLLTDHRPHGDGLIAHGFIRHLSERGHNLYMAAQEVDLRDPLPSNVHIFPIAPRTQEPAPIAALLHVACETALHGVAKASQISTLSIR